jgi:hypothetical protein
LLFIFKLKKEQKIKTTFFSQILMSATQVQKKAVTLYNNYPIPDKQSYKWQGYPASKEVGVSSSPNKDVFNRGAISSTLTVAGPTAGVNSVFSVEKYNDYTSITDPQKNAPINIGSRNCNHVRSGAPFTQVSKACTTKQVDTSNMKYSHGNSKYQRL